MLLTSSRLLRSSTVILCNFYRRLSSNESLDTIKQWLSNYSGGSVTLDRSLENIAIVEWENKLRHNAFTGFMCSQLDDVVKDLEKNCPKGVIFRGADGRFCSGGDLKFVEKISTSADGHNLSLFMQNITSRITNLPAISVSLIEGTAYGGGAELAMCTDFRLATLSARIAFTQVDMGLTTGWGGGPRLVKLIGREKALRLLLSGETVQPDEAFEMGLIDQVLRGAELADSGGRSRVDNPIGDAAHWLNRFVAKPSPKLISTMKGLVAATSTSDLSTHAESERQAFHSVWGSSVHLNALANFNQVKVKPKDNLVIKKINVE